MNSPMQNTLPLKSSHHECSVLDTHLHKLKRVFDRSKYTNAIIEKRVYLTLFPYVLVKTIALKVHNFSHQNKPRKISS